MSTPQEHELTFFVQNVLPSFSWLIEIQAIQVLQGIFSLSISDFQDLQSSETLVLQGILNKLNGFLI